MMGFDPVIFGAAAITHTLYQFWIHTKAIGRLHPWVEFWLNTPSHHRVHHAINPKYIDKNHAGVFMIWDRLFGTYHDTTEFVDRCGFPAGAESKLIPMPTFTDVNVESGK